MDFYKTRDLICGLQHHDEYIDFSIWDGRIPIRAHFNDEDWHNILSDVDNDEQLWNLVCCWCIQVYVVKDLRDCTLFGFIFVMIDSPRKDFVSIHGGGWNKKHTILFVRSYVDMIYTMLNVGLKVHTSCLQANNRARKLNRAVGFVTFCYKGEYEYKYITRSKLMKSQIFQRYFEKQLKF